MKGKNVEIQLYTPIVIESAEATAGGSGRQENISKITGLIADQGDAGILVEVKELFTEKQNKISPPHIHLFLPYHKIDHFYLV
jgi:hypothetical protein